MNRKPTTPVREGLTRSLTYTDNLMMAVLEFTDGPWDEPEPFHSHPHEQATYVVEGELIFYCEGREELHLRPGDTVAVDPDLKHTVKLLTPKARLVDTFTPLRTDFL